MTPNTDILIPIHGNRMFPVEECFEKCVDSICANTVRYRFIFVSDSCDETCWAAVDRVASRFTECNVVKTYKQHWYTRAMNLGLRLARTPWVVTLNCDVVVDKGWLEELYDVKDIVEKEVGRVGLVSSQLSGEEPRRYDITFKGKPPQDYCTGHAYLLNMQAMYEASCAHGTPGYPFDETKPEAIHIRSDVYLSWELNALGWQTVRSFKSWVGHIGGRSWGHQIGSIPGALDAVNYKY